MKKLRQGDIGKLVREWVPEFILFHTPLRNWYDSNCYRIFNGRDEDEVRGIPANRDILILKENNPHYSLKPVLVVEGSSTQIKNNKRVNMYHVSVYGINSRLAGTLLEISPGVKNIPKSQEVLKSNIEEHYVKVSSVANVSVKDINDALAMYN
jgi:hypothetical protein